MSSSSSSLEISVSVKRLGLMTETAFSKQNMGILEVINFADVKTEMAKLTKVDRDLVTSSKVSTENLARELIKI